jgi:glyoxylase-like metal-dependent hydrolase (beta-lactamase superfamily II)
VGAIGSDGEVVSVTGSARTLTYRPRRVTLSDGTFLMHESRGGTLSSVWAADLGDLFVEVVHLGHGPQGGELVLVVPDGDVVALGDLVPSLDPPAGPVAPTWPAAVDLAIGLTRTSTRILTSGGEIDRDALETYHQTLLGVLHG